MGSISSMLAGAQMSIHRGREVIGRPISLSPSGNNQPGSGDMMGVQSNSPFEDQTLGLYDHPLFDVGDSFSGEHWIDGNSEYGVDVLGYNANGNLNFGIGEDGFTAGVDAEASLYLYDVNGAYFNDYGRIEGGLMSGIQGDTGMEFRIDPLNWSGGLDVEAALAAGLFADGSISTDYGSINADIFAGIRADAGLEIEIDPSTWSGSVELESGLFVGVEVDTSATVTNGLVNADVGITGSFGPHADGSVTWTLSEGDIDFESDIDRVGLFTIDDAYANISLNGDGIREVGSDLYDRFDNFRTDMLLNNSFDHTADFPFVDDSWIDIEMEDSSFDLNDQMILNNIDMDSGAPDLDFDPDFYNNFELPPDSFIDPIFNPVNGFDAFGIDTGFDSFDPGIVDVVVPEPSIESGFDSGPIGPNDVQIGDGIWVDPAGFPDSFFDQVDAINAYNSEYGDLIDWDTDSSNAGSIGLTHNDNYTGISFNMGF